MTPELAFVVLLALMAAIAGGSFYGGWSAAQAYMQAAKSISDVTNTAIDRSNEFQAVLDKTTTESASLRAAIEKETEVIAEHRKAIEDGLIELFQGFERAGVVRSSRPSTPGRQVGDPPATG